jgi:hypothetical protein
MLALQDLWSAQRQPAPSVAKTPDETSALSAGQQ